MFLESKFYCWNRKFSKYFTVMNVFVDQFNFLNILCNITYLMSLITFNSFPDLIKYYWNQILYIQGPFNKIGTGFKNQNLLQDHYNYLIIFKIHSSCIDTLSSAHLPLVKAWWKLFSGILLRAFIIAAFTASMKSNRCPLSSLFIRGNKKKSGFGQISPAAVARQS